MRRVAILVSPFVTLALVLAFGWPVLLACFALALGTLLFSTGEAGAEASTDAPAPAPVTGGGSAVLSGFGSIEPMDADR